MSSTTGSTKYWTGAGWVLADGSVTSPPGAEDIGIVGGSALPCLPQSGTVSFFGLVAADIGTLEVDGTGPWTIAGTGGTDSIIDSLSVATGATVTVNSPIAVKNVIIRHIPGATTPATITLNDGLPPGAVIADPDEVIAYSAAFNGSYTNIAVDNADGPLANIAVAGNVQFSGAPVDDGSGGGTEIVVTGTQPVVDRPDFLLDVRSANDIGRTPGEFVLVGDTNVRPNSYQGTDISATAANGTVVSVPFGGSAVNPSQFERRLAYDPTNPAEAYEISPWTLTFKNGTSTLKAVTPSLVGVTPPPFASNVTVSGDSANPTFTWSYPSGSINGVYFDIFDATDKNSSGNADLVYSATISGNSGTYTVPNALDGGLTLLQGHHYTLDLYGVATRDPSEPISDSNSKAWSESYFDFVPTGGTIPQVYLPTITTSGAYQFKMSVTAGQTYFIDPAVATGYTYTTAAGDPNFASVVLPGVQTAPYTISFLHNGVQETDSIAPNTVFALPTGGVSSFTVTGIDPADNLDPSNATAFATGLTFVADGNFDGTQTPIVTQTLCFCAGTLIATPSGEVPVERLAVGDTVLTVRGEAWPVTWIGVGHVLATRGRRTAATPVIVRKGALAENVPYQDLRVTKGHAFYLEDALIPVEFLVNHRSILWDDRAQAVVLYHVELDRHDVLLANGAPAESYRDDGNRWLFQNANSGWGLPPQEPCAPVLTGGSIIDIVWRRLLDRAGSRKSLPLTDDPDLHLIVDGKRIDATERRDDMYAFRLQRRPRGARICSRAAVPQELGIARDNRPLGVAVRRIVLAHPRRQCAIGADSALLTDGYHAFEADNGIRWTNGDADVPADLFVGTNSPCILLLYLGGATQYLDEGIAVRVA